MLEAWVHVPSINMSKNLLFSLPSSLSGNCLSILDLDCNSLKALGSSSVVASGPGNSSNGICPSAPASSSTCCMYASSNALPTLIFTFSNTSGIRGTVDTCFRRNSDGCCNIKISTWGSAIFRPFGGKAAQTHDDGGRRHNGQVSRTLLKFLLCRRRSSFDNIAGDSSCEALAVRLHPPTSLLAPPGAAAAGSGRGRNPI